MHVHLYFVYPHFTIIIYFCKLCAGLEDIPIRGRESEQFHKNIYLKKKNEIN